jgi:GNAT superfamily N-acetyltransferase
MDYRLRPLAPADTHPARVLWRRRFGGDPETQQRWMEAALAPDRPVTATVAVPAATDAVVGVGLLDVAGPAHTRRYLSLDALDLGPPLAPRNGLFHVYCVRSDWEGRGIGTALYRRHLRHLRTEGVRRAFGISWHRPHTIDSRVLFEKCEFVRLAMVERYYERFSERPHCPDCDGACTCDASLHARTIKGEESPDEGRSGLV